MTIKPPTSQQIPALRALWQEAFGDTDAFLDTFWETAFCAQRCRCVTVENRLAAALYWFDCQYLGKKIAYIYAVATAKAFQGQGICRALMENTHAHLAAKGYQGAVLVPGSEALFSMYGDMGYGCCSQIREIACTAGEKPVVLQTVDAAEYGTLRRHMLPGNAVVQEEENLEFLQTQAALYAGADFLLAARREGNILQGMELLGHADAAPGILQALECQSGTFRMPGEGKPFAMYHELGECGLPAPEYFGLAFD